MSRETIDIRIADPPDFETESALQISVVNRAMMLMTDFPEVALLHAIPNGDWRGPRVAQKLKAEGVKPGIPDLCLPVPRGGYHGLYLELKRGRGKASPEQWAVMQELHAHGYYVRLANCDRVAGRIIHEYLQDNKLRYED